MEHKLCNILGGGQLSCERTKAEIDRWPCCWWISCGPLTCRRWRRRFWRNHYCLGNESCNCFLSFRVIGRTPLVDQCFFVSALIVWFSIYRPFLWMVIHVLHLLRSTAGTLLFRQTCRHNHHPHEVLPRSLRRPGSDNQLRLHRILRFSIWMAMLRCGVMPRAMCMFMAVHLP